MRSLFHRLLICLGVAMGTAASAQEPVIRNDLLSVFENAGVTGGFVLFAPDTGQLTVVNPDFAAPRRIPASTFKIANSLIALETGAVADVDEVIPYRGGRTAVAAWAKDMPMREAITVSNVPVYQELARRIGRAAYQDWLHRLSYGNADPGTDTEHFWLKGPLQISPLEQAEFLAKLARGQLAVSAEAQAQVRDILHVNSHQGRALFAKSGWTTAPSPDIGWYVGWVEAGAQIHSFALVLEIRQRSDAKLRQALAERLLGALGVF